MQRGGHAAEMAGSSMDEYAQSLVFLNKNMAAARDGNAEMLVNFARVGITLADLRKPGYDAMMAFEQMSDTFQRVGDGGNNANKKVAVSTALLGRSGFRMIQMMNGGSAAMRLMYAEADRLGVVLSDDTVQAMTGFNDSWGRMRSTAFGAIATAATPAINALARVAEWVTKWTAANRGLLASRMAEYVQRVQDGFPAFANGAMQVVRAVRDLAGYANDGAQAIGGWGNVIRLVAAIVAVQGVVAIGSLTAAVWGLGAAFLATPLGWIAALVAGAGLVLKYWEPMNEFFMKLWDSAGRFFGGDMPQASAGPSRPGGGTGPHLQAWAGAPVATGQYGAAALGGVLKIAIDSEGRPAVTQLKKAPGSMLDFDLQYAGSVMR